MGVDGYQGFAGNMANKYSTIGNSGMTKREIKQQGELASAEYKQQATLEKQPERQAFCQMWGINAQQFDYNGDGLIGKKEFADIQKFVQRYGAQGLQGQQSSSGFSNPLELLNSKEAQNLLGTIGDVTGATGSGGFLSALGLGGSGGSGDSGSSGIMGTIGDIFGGFKGLLG